ncbi:P-loop NTPase [Nostocoides sp. F2B08]|uniref:polysaccharide biosynthesis tyrosine autokinase n=1 Tax=Nostocoides sp. F2B08 TaxID=2653936 RepID=UPI001262EC9D|nr:polysaccharide biosynthesis tyrosine autokinase [Tetrasphaera sp. F2B08]KAB7743348.1 P-loop NTPase [Tetrasphaera sp. F2B08]
MTLRDYAKVFSHRWLLITVVTLVTALATFLLTPAQSVSNTAQSYTATATILADSRGSEDGTTPGLTLGRIALFITTGEVPQLVASQVAYEGEPALLGQRIVVTRDPESASLSIASTEGNPERAEEIANTFADQSVAFFEEPRPETGDTELVVLQRAVAVPNEGGVNSIIPPGRFPRTILAAFLGLLLGMAIALVIERFDSRMRDRREIQTALGMPIIAEIHKLRGKDRQHAATMVSSNPRSSTADGYRAARTAVTHTLSTTDAGSSYRPPLILVTSANPGEGKTTSVANLALSFAESGKSVLVLDADFHSPDLHRAFDVPQGVGISDHVIDPKAFPITSLIRPTNAPNVNIVTAGTQLHNPATLASRTGSFLEMCRNLADVVLIDSAPVLAASDMFDIIPLVDTVVLVARSGRLTEHDATRVAELLSRFRIPVSGVITIGSRMPRARRYGYGYGEYPAGKKPLSGRRAGRVETPPSEWTEDDAVTAGATRRSRRETRGDSLDY